MPFQGSSFFLASVSAHLVTQASVVHNNGIAPDALDRTVERGEQAAPNAEVAAENRCPRLDSRDCSYPPLPIW